MAAYVIADLTITDPQGFEQYRQMVPATIAEYGGKYRRTRRSDGNA